MNVDRLLANYERVADAPDTIIQLRRFVLDLAVRGKLVPQDVNDEPASNLLKQIAVKKLQRIKAGERLYIPLATGRVVTMRPVTRTTNKRINAKLRSYLCNCSQTLCYVISEKVRDSHRELSIFQHLLKLRELQAPQLRGKIV